MKVVDKRSEGEEDFIFISDENAIYIGDYNLSHWEFANTIPGFLAQFDNNGYGDEYGLGAGFAQKGRVKFYDVTDSTDKQKYIDSFNAAPFLTEKFIEAPRRFGS